ncbi:RNase E specificity factor CsrD [Enterobacillus tribolii]|uniref:Diguanylate cyclase/phosphodiesterase n=1 Tax=Enterobacillus tribolii TaxID=1487935 RepID=A0A370QGP2_9GAMM|nr:RNase E specificity factor CsrD [Enterobacillus tribolii]MBW7981787.1 RNase E specificity factor CsrD [Enterobacillus tribolii]RDK87469.1 diguanylate cyclase/phosphodiesterase [Enterobacillus tribolii]
MRITTKLFALITVLVSVAMLLMLLGSSLSFFYQNNQRTEYNLNTLTTSLDQALLTESRPEIKKWLPALMRSTGVVELAVMNNGKVVYEHHLPGTYGNAWETYNNLRTYYTQLMHFPGYSLRLVYVDPMSSFSRSLRSTLSISFSIAIMIVILMLCYRWLKEQTEGMEKLERRARRILAGDGENVKTGDIYEFPPNASSAIDRLLHDLSDAREERSRVDTLIRSFAAQDSSTGLNNRLFFDNQLTTQLEDEGAHGVVMMVRLPDVDTLRVKQSLRETEEFRNGIVNLLSTFVMRYPSALLARYFQANFAIMLPHRSLKEAEGFAAQLINAIDSLPPMPGVPKDEVMHIGICLYHYGQSAEQIMDATEQAARNAMLQGGNSWFVDYNQTNEVVRGSVKWRTLLEQTITRGGPVLYQKPAVSAEGEVHHRDIIAHIYDGKQTLLSAEFYPLVQQLGMTESYDRQMLSRIIPLLRQWQDETLAFPVSVDSLLQRSFQLWLRDTLLQNEKSLRQRILFELAEADVCQHIDRLRPVVRLIQGMGCQVIVAQAGLKVVSTSYIKQLQVTMVKLHPGLVRNIDKRVENQLFVQSLTSACEGTSACVFAASVRTREEWLTLKAKGIAGGQGDFFAQPKPVTIAQKKYSRRYKE